MLAAAGGAATPEGAGGEGPGVVDHTSPKVSPSLLSSPLRHYQESPTVST
jgi:hypothetical protein